MYFAQMKRIASGFRRVMHLSGAMQRWEGSGRPVERGGRPSMAA